MADGSRAFEKWRVGLVLPKLAGFWRPGGAAGARSQWFRGETGRAWNSFLVRVSSMRMLAKR